MRKPFVALSFLGLMLVACHHSNKPQEPKQIFPGLVGIHSIYLGNFGNGLGSDMVKEKIRYRLLSSTRFTVLETPEKADATLTGNADIDVRFGGGNTSFNSTAVLRLIRTKDSTTVWMTETRSGTGHRSASSTVAQRLVNKLIEDANNADEAARGTTTPQPLVMPEGK